MLITKLGPYQVLEEIGQGGMATVYRAYHPIMNRQVAIKVIHRAIARDGTVLERFRREARLIARLEHAHILPVYDFDGAHDPPYIVMPYMDSGTLKDALQQRSLPFEEIIAILQQIAGALDYAHRQGIIHRDIKPSNIMLDREGNAFLADFGTARIIFTSKLSEGQNTDITGTGEVVGTPDYLAPEQATHDDEVGPAADIYALGVVLFQMLSGQLPYSSESAFAVIIKHAQAPIPRLTALKPDLPVAVDAVIARAMAKRPADRYPSASALVTALVEAVGGIVRIPGGRPATIATLLSKTTGLIAAGLNEQHKLVTALCLDAAKYAGLVEETAGLEAAHQALSRLWESIKRIPREYGGQIISQTERQQLILWGVEAARKDDPEQAIRAALAIQALLRQSLKTATAEAGPPLGIGIHSGTALVIFNDPAGEIGAEGVSASGTPLSLAARLAQQAGSKILISHDTFRHVLGIFDVAPDQPLKLRGSKDELQVYQVVAAKAHAFRLNVREIEGIKTRLIGRERELGQLQQAFSTAIQERQAQAITINGAAGLGKSRLLYEFSAWADLRPEKFWFFRGRATPGMTHRPYALLRDLLSYRFKLYDSDLPAVLRNKLETGLAELIPAARPEMAHLIGYLAGFDVADSPHIKGIWHDPQQLTHLARRAFIQMFTLLCEQSPVVMLLEDIHWADEASLDLFQAVMVELSRQQLLLIAAARPLLYERRPTWGEGQPGHRRLVLEPLSKQNSQLLIRNILQKLPETPGLLIELIVDRAEGNPHFIEELIKMLIEERIIHKSEEVWTVETERLAHLPVPATLMGLLQARLASLLHPERVVLQRAAVIGRVFWDSAVAALETADGLALGEVEPILQALATRDFIYRRGTTAFAGNQEYSFVQSMLRDVIYDSLSKRQQQAYHVGMAAWLLKIGGDRIEEYTALIADHYEKAGEVQKAAEFLAQAGQRAMQVSAFNEALTFYERGLAILPLAPAKAEALAPAKESQLLILLKLGEINWLMGNFAQARGHLEAGLALARQLGQPRGIAEALYLLSQVAIKQGNFIRAQQCLAESLPLARQLNEPITLARVLYGMGDLIWRLSQYAEALPYLEESLLLARQHDDQAQLFDTLNRLGTVDNSLKAYDKAREHYEQGLALALRTGNRRWVATSFNNLGVVDYYTGNYLEARNHFEEALAIAREINQRDSEALYLLSVSDACFKLGDIAAAQQYARAALQLAMAIGGMLWAVYAMVIFAELRAHAGDTEGALALLGLALHHPAADANTREEVERVLAELKLNPETVETGLIRGRVLDFERVVEELLQES
jgi:tetratricopeptide (TPR) repeat protein/class 3 adenylate cyclase/tRNA A-37 threonylcarbamoyl transferase component Bud32